MDLDSLENENLEVQIDDITLVFKPASQRDVIVAWTAVEYAQGLGDRVPPITLEKVTTHVFANLIDIKGEIRIKGEPISLDVFKAMGQNGKVSGLVALKIIGGWGVQILKANGFFKIEPSKVAPN